ncbi:MAG: pseudouridine synthase, partial [Anaerolinea sp.]|nr:pseudouridine synthase [Anaerolinea sp.]
MKERIQKLLAQANIASRRAAEEYIEQGRVRVNGVVATLGDKADPAADVIELDGEKLKFDQRAVYIAVNKPRNVLVTHKAHRGDDRRTIIDMIGRRERLFAIGRLDADSEGLVVLTNDGDLAQKLTHPRFRHTKTYTVEVYGTPDSTALEKWQNGIFIDDERTAPCLVDVVKTTGGISTLNIVMIEGKKRQIRRVASTLGYPVRKLVRTHIGMLELSDDLAPGQWRELTDEEIKLLQTPSPRLKDIRGRSAQRSAERRRPDRDDDDVEDRPRRSSFSRFRDEAEREESASTPRNLRRAMDTDRPRYPRRDDERPRYPRRDDERPQREGSSSGDRPRYPRRDDDRPQREGSSSSDRPRYPRRDDDRPRREGSSDTDRPRYPRRDDDRPRREGTSGGDRPRYPRRDDDRPRREASSDTGRPRYPRRDDDRPQREGSSSGDRPRYPRRDD